MSCFDKIENKYVMFLMSHAVTISFALILSTAFMILNVKDGDDLFFRGLLNNTDFITCGVDFYNSVNGRFLLGFTFPTLIQESNIHLLRLLLILSAFMLSFNLIRIVNFYSENKLSNAHKIVFYMSFFMFYYSSIGGAVLWFTGAYVYFLPYAFYTYFFATLLRGTKERLSFCNKFLCIFLLVCLCSYEQTSMLALFTLIFVSIFHKNIYNSRFLILCFIIIVIGFMIIFSAEGNYKRLASEINTWYPIFNDISFGAKIYNTFQLILESMLVLNIRFSLFFAIVLLCICINKYKNNKILTYGSYLSCVVIVVTIIFPYFVEGLSSHTPYGEKIDILLYNQYYNITLKLVTAFIISVLFVCFVSYQLVSVLKTKQYIVPVFFILIAGILTFSAMAFSPTIYASGYRTHFMMNMSMMIVLGILLSKIDSSKCLIVLNAIAIFLCLTQGLILIEKFSKSFL